jgi:hypothetical protein
LKVSSVANAAPDETASTTVKPKPARETVRGFLVAIDGTTVCRNCSAKGQIPHHLSLVFWQFWTFAQLTALIAAMSPSEHLIWIGRGTARLQNSDGRTRELVEVDGMWIEADA